MSDFLNFKAEESKTIWFCWKCHNHDLEDDKKPSVFARGSNQNIRSLCVVVPLNKL